METSPPATEPTTRARSARPDRSDGGATVTGLPVRPLPVAGRRPWMDQAACVGRTTLFFGLAGERPERRVRREARARSVCADCPVIAPCRAMARDNGENGFWGGESEEDRAEAGFPPISISRRAVQDAVVSGQQSRSQAG